MKELSRRDFVKKGTIAAIGLTVLPAHIQALGNNKKNVRIGIIGTGNRGTSLLKNLLSIEGNEIVAVCDLFQTRVDNAAELCVQAGKKRPKVYCKNEHTWSEMLDREKQLDAVIIATYWESHTSIALYAMNKGIIPGIEVPASLTLAETWSLVDTSEKTGVQFMMLENWSFRQDNLALLNMKRLGLFGEGA